jgi:hypothetical protein
MAPLVRIKILLEVDDGVIDALCPVDENEVDVVFTSALVIVLLTTCNTPPVTFNPRSPAVGVEPSASWI